MSAFVSWLRGQPLWKKAVVIGILMEEAHFPCDRTIVTLQELSVVAGAIAVMQVDQPEVKLER